MTNCKREKKGEIAEVYQQNLSQLPERRDTQIKEAKEKKDTAFIKCLFAI